MPGRCCGPTAYHRWRSRGRAPARPPRRDGTSDRVPARRTTTGAFHARCRAARRGDLGCAPPRADPGGSDGPPRPGGQPGRQRRADLPRSAGQGVGRDRHPRRRRAPRTPRLRGDDRGASAAGTNAPLVTASPSAASPPAPRSRPAGSGGAHPRPGALAVGSHPRHRAPVGRSHRRASGRRSSLQRRQAARTATPTSLDAPSDGTGRSSAPELRRPDRRGPPPSTIEVDRQLAGAPRTPSAAGARGLPQGAGRRARSPDVPRSRDRPGRVTEPTGSRTCRPPAAGCRPPRWRSATRANPGGPPSPRRPSAGQSGPACSIGRHPRPGRSTTGAGQDDPSTRPTRWCHDLRQRRVHAELDRPGRCPTAGSGTAGNRTVATHHRERLDRHARAARLHRHPGLSETGDATVRRRSGPLPSPWYR